MIDIEIDSKWVSKGSYSRLSKGDIITIAYVGESYVFYTGPLGEPRSCYGLLEHWTDYFEPYTKDQP